MMKIASFDHQLERAQNIAMQTDTKSSIQVYRKTEAYTSRNVAATAIMCFATTLTLFIATAASHDKDAELDGQKKFIQLRAKAELIEDVSAIVWRTIKQTSGLPTLQDKYLYSCLPRRRVARIDALGLYRTNDIVITNVAYSYFLDARVGTVKIQRAESVALLDESLSRDWLLLASVLGWPESHAVGPSVEIRHVKTETVDGQELEVFLLIDESGMLPRVVGKLWIGVDDGLVYRAEWGRDIFELHAVKINTGVKEVEFHTEKVDIPTISSAEFGSWMRRAISQGSGAQRPR